MHDFFAPMLDLPKELESKIETINEQCILDKNLHYFDWTASGLAAKCVEYRISRILPFYANTHSSSNSSAAFMQELYNGAKKRLRNIFKLDSNYAIISCGFGSTAAIKKFQELVGIYLPPKTKAALNLQNLNKDSLPLVIVGPYEHHSNELSFREGLCEVVRIPLNELGLLDLESLKSTLEANKGRKIIASFSLGSNVSGILTPFDKVSHLVRTYGGIMCFDCASTSAYFDIPKEFYDAIFLSPHKLLGGIGSSGILIINRALIDKTLPPTFCGGGVVSYVSRQNAQYFSQDEVREEVGTPGILELLRAYLGYALREEISTKWINEIKKQRIAEIREFLENEEKIKIYGNPSYNVLGIFSFNIESKSPFEIAENLSKNHGILTRAGCSCAGPYGHDLLGLEDNANLAQKPGWIRLNAHYTHSLESIEHLKNALKECL